MSLIQEILEEWEGGCYYNNELLSDAYTQFLLALLETNDEDRQDPRIPAFLLCGYTAYKSEQNDPQTGLTYRMALSMVGGEVPTPVSPATPPPGPSRKRPLEEDAPEPTLEVVETRERELRRFKTKFREEIMIVKGLGAELPSEQLMEGMFNTMLARQRDAVKAKDDDRVILEIANADNVDNPLWFSMRRTDQMNGRKNKTA